MYMPVCMRITRDLQHVVYCCVICVTSDVRRPEARDTSPRHLPLQALSASEMAVLSPRPLTAVATNSWGSLNTAWPVQHARQRFCYSLIDGFKFRFFVCSRPLALGIGN